MVSGMLLLLRKFFWVAVGAAGALELDRLVGRQRAKWSPAALTTALLDKINASLEKRS
jgi:hypothetical protein